MWETLKRCAARAIAASRVTDEGQTLVEYVLITGLVSVALILALVTLAGGLNGLYTTIISKL